AVPDASADRGIGNPGSIAPVAPLSAARDPFSSPTTTSFTPSPLMSATTALAVVALLVSDEKRDDADHGASRVPFRSNTYTRPLVEATTMSGNPSPFMSASAGEQACGAPSIVSVTGEPGWREPFTL